VSAPVKTAALGALKLASGAVDAVTPPRRTTIPAVKAFLDGLRKKAKIEILIDELKPGNAKASQETTGK